MNKNIFTNTRGLNDLDLKTFTEQDTLDYCQINSIEYKNVILLSLDSNKLTDISGVKIFENLIQLNLEHNKITDISVIKNLNKLKNLYLYNNQIKDISVIQYLNNLEFLHIENLELESDQVKYINSCKNLISLWCSNGFEDMSVLNQLNKSINIYHLTF